MGASGNSVATKSFQSFAVSEGLLAKCVEAVKMGVKNAQSSGDVQSLELFIIGFRQNISIGRLFIISPKVCSNHKDFPIALLYGTFVREFNLGEETADYITNKIGESEFDSEYTKADFDSIKERIFYDEESKEYKPLILFAPNWSNVREYIGFKYTDDEGKLANLLRHLVFAAYYNPAVSSAFDALMTTVDTHKFDVTDITPKLSYPFLSENPLRAYPDLIKQAGWARSKVYLTRKTADEIAQEMLEPAELNVFEALDMALTEATLPETDSMEEVADFKGPGGSNEGNLKTSAKNCTICGKPVILSPSAQQRSEKHGEPASHYTNLFTTHAECELDKRKKETSDLMSRKRQEAEDSTVYINKGASIEGDGTELRHNPDYGEKGSYTQEMNEENLKSAGIDRDTTACKDCGQKLDAFKLCPDLSPSDGAKGLQYCGKDRANTSLYGKAAGIDRNVTTCKDCGQKLDAFKLCPDLSPSDGAKGLQYCGKGRASLNMYNRASEKTASTWLDDLKKSDPKLYAAYQIVGNQSDDSLRGMVKALSLPISMFMNTPEDEKRLAAAKYILNQKRRGKKAEAPFETPFTNVGPGTSAHEHAEKAIAVKVDTIQQKGNPEKDSPIGIEIDETGVAVRASLRKATVIAKELTRDIDTNHIAMSTKAKAALLKREAELDKLGGRKKRADVALTEESIWDAITEDFGEAPQVELPGEGSGSSSDDSESYEPKETSDDAGEASEPEEKAPESEDKSESTPDRPKSKLFSKDKEAAVDVDPDTFLPKGHTPMPSLNTEPKSKWYESEGTGGWPHKNGKIFCPNCGSNDVSVNKEKSKEGWNEFSLGATEYNFCNDCGNSSKKTVPQSAGKTALLYMNDYDIQNALDHFQSDPTLGPAVRFLSAFKEEVDSHSDGWAYWKAPVAAAGQLMTLIQNAMNGARTGKRTPVTPQDIAKAMAPIKAFMTRKGLAAGMQMPKLAIKKNAFFNVQEDLSQAKAEVVSPDTIDSDIKQPTESVPEAASVTAGISTDFQPGNDIEDGGWNEPVTAAAGDEEAESIHMGLSFGDLADLADNLPHQDVHEGI